jgi:hypothetical protein
MKLIHEEEMILCNDIRTCDRCGEETMWMRPRQRSKGQCLNHTIPSQREPSLPDLLRLVAQVFPGTSAHRGRPVPRYAPDEYGQRLVKVVDSSRWSSGEPYWRTDTARPLDAGPCEGCRRTVRRYGPEGYPYCTECEPVS